VDLPLASANNGTLSSKSETRLRGGGGGGPKKVMVMMGRILRFRSLRRLLLCIHTVSILFYADIYMTPHSITL